MTYPIQFRRKVMKLHAEGVKYKDLSYRFGISIRTLCRWSNEIEPQKTRNKPWKKLSKEALMQDIKEHPASYSYERAQRLGITTSGIKYAMKRLGVTYKKNAKSSEGRSRKKIYVLPRD